MANTSNKSAPLLPAYLIVGEDELKRDAVMARLRVRVAERGDIEFNCDVLSGETCTGGEIVNACNTMPFASDVRLVEVRGADKLKKADSEPVVSYLSSPSETTVLALVADKLAKGTRLYKAVAALGKTAVIDCAPQKRRDLARTVRALGKAQGVTLTEAAADKLIDLVGENTVRLDSEVKKIALAHVGSASVTDEEVARLCARTTEAKPWQFVDALSARDVRACLALLGKMESASPYALIAMCANRIRELICAKSLDARGRARDIASALKQPDWRVKNHTRWARGFSAQELRDALVTARDAERDMKSGSDPEAAFLMWALGVAGGTKAKTR